MIKKTVLAMMMFWSTGSHAEVCVLAGGFTASAADKDGHDKQLNIIEVILDGNDPWPSSVKIKTDHEAWNSDSDLEKVSRRIKGPGGKGVYLGSLGSAAKTSLDENTKASIFNRNFRIETLSQVPGCSDKNGLASGTPGLHNVSCSIDIPKNYEKIIRAFPVADPHQEDSDTECSQLHERKYSSNQGSSQTGSQP